MSANGINKSPSEARTGDHKAMGLVLRVQVLKGRNLAPKDKSGTSDPYLVLTLGDSKQATSVVNKTLSPEWNQTFEFPVVTADSALLEVICWDKDRFKKDYMGEFDVVLEDIFTGGHTMPEQRWMKLESRRAGKKKKKDQNVTGEILLKFTLYDPVNTAATQQQIIQKFYGVVAEIEGDDDYDDDDDDPLNRVTSRDLDDVDEEDDEDDEEKEPSDDADDGVRTPGGTLNTKGKKRRQKKIEKLRRKNKLKAYEFSGMSDVAGVLFLEINRITDLPPEKNSTRTTFDMDPFVVTSVGKKTYRTRVVNHNLNPVYDEKLVFQVQKHEVNFHLNFAVVDRDKFSGNDFVGTTSFPVDKIAALAPDADPKTGLYKLPDPDSVSPGEAGDGDGKGEGKKKRFRLPISRSSSQTNLSRNNSSGNLNRLSRTTSNQSLKGEQTPQQTRPGLRRFESENDVVEQTSHRPAPTSAPSYAAPTLSTTDYNNGNGTTPHNAGNSDDPDLYAYELPLELKNKARWQEKHRPVLYIRAKYLPYKALRQQFWRAMLKQYDADESGKLDKVELITMLDTLGSTLHNSTIDGFFTRWKETNGGEEMLTMDQAVVSLEEQLMKSTETRDHLHRPNWARGQSTLSVQDTGVEESSPGGSPGATTPYLGGIDVSKLHDAPPNLNPTRDIPALEVSDASATEGGETFQPQDPRAPSNLTRTESWGTVDSEADLNDESTSQEEHVVEIQECPICHMPRLNARGKKGKRRGATDADIITHIATCASSDWRAVNNLVMAGFVTSSQAQRKWYSKVVSKISYGGYKLGANSANILVQDRITGMINEERMSVYVSTMSPKAQCTASFKFIPIQVRLGIRLLYKGLKSRDMETKRSKPLNDITTAAKWVSRRSTSALHSIGSG